MSYCIVTTCLFVLRYFLPFRGAPFAYVALLFLYVFAGPLNIVCLLVFVVLLLMFAYAFGVFDVIVVYGVLCCWTVFVVSSLFVVIVFVCLLFVIVTVLFVCFGAVYNLFMCVATFLPDRDAPRVCCVVSLCVFAGPFNIICLFVCVCCCCCF